MCLSGEQALALGRRRQGLELGKCPHSSSQCGAPGGTQLLSAAGKHPGIADGASEAGSGLVDLPTVLCLAKCVFFELVK